MANQPATVDATNNFNGTAVVPPGTQTVQVKATDFSSNTRTSTYQTSETGATTTFTYDANGNLSSDGSKVYGWDAENRLLDVKQATTTLASFTYDGRGRRATKTASGVTTSYVYDGAQFLEERPGAGTPKRYVYGLGIDHLLAQSVGGVTSYFIADHLGSIVRVTDSFGTPTLTREYDPWGNLLQGSTPGGYAFTGREWDPETSLYYYRARYIDPKLGRFVSEDPAGLEGGLNRYAYVQNKPTTSVDPSGLRTQICCRHLSFTSLKDHCFVVITCNPNVSGGRMTTYSLIPQFGWGAGSTSMIGIAHKNWPDDRGALFGGETTGCHDVGDCDRCKEQIIDASYSDEGPSRNYSLLGPNSNTYTRYQTKLARCKPPAHLPNAPGYEYPLGF